MRWLAAALLLPGLLLPGLLAGCASAGTAPVGDPVGAPVGARDATPEVTGMPAPAHPPAGRPAGSGRAVPDHGFRLNVPLPRPHFTLTDTSGRAYDFAARTRGRATLLYFGYTRCPDQCPTALADVATALRALPAATRSAVTVVFVTTDPAHDTPAVVRDFLAHFDPSFVGLTGTPAAVTRAQQAASVTVARATPTAEATRAAPASTAHGGGLLAYGTDDYAHLTYPAGTSVGDLTADLPLLTSR